MSNITSLVASWIGEYRKSHINAAWVLMGHQAGDRSDKVALQIIRDIGKEQTFTFGELDDLSARLAQGLRDLGVGPGDRVAALLPKGLEVTLTVLATWRLGATYVPLFTAFGTDAIHYRLTDSGAKIVITDPRNIPKVPDGIPTILTTPQDNQHLSFDDLLQSPCFPAWEWRNGEDAMMVIYTSGTTGHPKGVIVPIWAMAAFQAYMKFGLDLREDDRFWNLADPGWAYGLYYGLIGPFLMGHATTIYLGRFDPQAIIDVLAHYHITNFAAAPTAFRALRASDLDPLQTSLRVISSAGEPLNPEVSVWSEATFGVPIFDHYGQTELGMMINNHHTPELRDPVLPGSMGRAMPGFQAVILDDNGNELMAGQEGHLALDVARSPLFWFAGYYNAPERSRDRFSPSGQYYLTGDDASRDADSHFYFSGRSDDIILSAGYRIGPFEVENALMSHPSVAECAVIGVPDSLRGETVKAFVVLRPGYTPTETLITVLKEWVREHLAKTAYPRDIAFVSDLPKTPSGKVQRYRLRSSP